MRKQDDNLVDRRDFLVGMPLAVGVLPLLNMHSQGAENAGCHGDATCWLDVCAPFVIDDEELGMRSEIILTSDTFVGTAGYADGADQTEYEIYLFDTDGLPVGENGVAKRLTVPAMHNTVLPVSE